GMSGLANLEEFVRQGGLLVTVEGNAVIPIETAMATGVTEAAPPPSLIAGGGVVRATVTASDNPIAYGYGKNVALYYKAGPILEVGAGGGRGGRRVRRRRTGRRGHPLQRHRRPDRARRHP